MSLAKTEFSTTLNIHPSLKLKPNILTQICFVWLLPLSPNREVFVAGTSLVFICLLFAISLILNSKSLSILFIKKDSQFPYFKKMLS
jgi:hypothetical protein